jgi:hypothetical protein
VVKYFIVMRVFGAIAFLTAIVPQVASAQHITINGRLSPVQPLVGPKYTISANT